MPRELVNTRGMDRADVLRALYNAAKTQGLSILHYKEGDMPKWQAQQIIDHRKRTHSGLYFDYLSGRVMKVDISNPTLDVSLYDRDNGPGAARRAIEAVQNESKLS